VVDVAHPAAPSDEVAIAPQEFDHCATTEQLELGHCLWASAFAADCVL